MKTKARFVIYPQSAKSIYDPDCLSFYVSDAEFTEITSLYPSGLKVPPGGKVFKCEINNDQPAYKQISDFLQKCGYSPQKSRVVRRAKMEYPLEYHRYYDKSDWECCQFVEPKPQELFVVMGDRRDDGNLRIPKYTNRKGSILGVSGFWIIITDAFRREIEREGFKGVQFKDVFVSTGWKKPDIPLLGRCELTSGITMPPISQTVSKLYNNHGLPFDGDYNKGCHLIEDLYMPSELHYSESEINAVNDVDIALTKESYGSPENQHLVVSKRFYDFCNKHKAKMDWIPVRIDLG